MKKHIWPIVIVLSYWLGAIVSSFASQSLIYLPVLWLGGSVALLAWLVRQDDNNHYESISLNLATAAGAMIGHGWSIWMSGQVSGQYFFSYHVVGLGIADAIQIYLIQRLIVLFKVRYFELVTLQDILKFLIMACTAGVAGGLAIKQGIVSFYWENIGNGLISASYYYWFIADLLSIFVFTVLALNIYYRKERLWSRRLMEVSLPALVTFVLVMVLTDVTCPSYFKGSTDNEEVRLFSVISGEMNYGCQVAKGGVLFNFLLLGSLLFVSGRYYRNEESMREGAERVSTINRKLAATLKSSWAMNANMRQGNIANIAAATAFHVANLKYVMVISGAYSGSPKVYGYNQECFKLVDLDDFDFGGFINDLNHHEVNCDVVNVDSSDRIEDLILAQSRDKHCSPLILHFPTHQQGISNEGVVSGQNGALIVFSENGKGVSSNSETLLRTIASSASIAMWNLQMLLRERENSSRLSQSDTVLNSASEGIFIVDKDLRITQINPSFIRITGLSKRETIGRLAYRLSCFRVTIDVFKAMRDALSKQGSWESEFDCTRADGSKFSVSITLTAVKDKTGIVYFAGVFSDITRFKENAYTLQHQADHDDLTGLANRKRFNRELSDSLVRAGADNTRCGVLYIDLDKFKQVNDTMGHHTGDELLIQVSKRLQSCVRDSDLISRLGGDEFAIILRSISSVEAVERVAKGVLESLGHPFTLNGKEVYISGSIGLSIFPDHGRDHNELMRFADSAMYETKRDGRNGFTAYTPEISETAQERYDIQDDLRKAFKSNEFELYYQPQVRVDDDSLVGLEALVRWNHPVRGLLAPGMFMDVAEEGGFMPQLDDWVLEEGFRQYREWQDEGLDPGRLSLNISGVQITSSIFPDRLMKWVEIYGVDPGNIELEISENFVMKQATTAIKILNRIRELGFYLSIDDFGTGYSSLSYLKKLPIDTLKIDGSFIRDVMDDADDASIAIAIITLAKNMRMRVIAEGVETQSQRNFLRENEAEIYQGYLFSRPIPADAVKHFFKRASQ